MPVRTITGVDSSTQALLFAVLGAVLGTAGAYIAGRSLQALLAGVSPVDPAAYAAAYPGAPPHLPLA